MAGFLGWLLAKSIAETEGMFWAGLPAVLLKLATPLLFSSKHVCRGSRRITTEGG